MIYALFIVLWVPLCNGGRSRGCRDGDASLEFPFFGALVFIPLGAAIVGVAKPWVRNVFGAMLVGWVVVLPASVTLWLTAEPSLRRGPRGFFFMLALSFAIGSLYGAAAWVGRAREPKRRRG